MRITVILCFVLLPLWNGAIWAQTAAIACSSQADSLTGRTVYLLTDQMPEVVGGEETLIRELRQIRYPDQGCYGGKVIIAFIVDTDGKATGKRIIKDPSGDKFGSQMLDRLDHITWIPGSCQGIPVPVLYHVPVIIDVR